MERYLIAFALGLFFAGTTSIAAPSERPSDKAPAGKVKLIVSRGAQKILKRNAATLRDGVLRVRGIEKTYDIATGSGVLRVIVDPKDPESLKIGLYDRGRRYSAVGIEFPRPPFRPQVAITPVSDEEADKLFPKKE